MKRHIKNRQKGGVMILTVIFFLIISFIIITSSSFIALKDVRNANNQLYGKISYYTAESGFEDAYYRLKNALSIASNTLTLGNNTTRVTLTASATSTSILSEATSTSFYKRIQSAVALGDGVSFHYGIQSGAGGFTLSNSSTVTGNVYSEGPVISLSGSGNMIYGDIVSGGSSGLVYGIHATGSVYAHTIGLQGNNNTIVDHDAYYQTIISTTVSGTQHPNSPDQATTSLPIPDQTIADWEADALAGGILSSSFCDTYSGGICTISSDKTISAKKIPFNLVIKNHTLTVSGPLWVTGDLEVQGQATIRMSASLGSQNVPIIADNPSNTTGSGIITTGQGAAFYGSGSIGSYVFMISQNKSAELGGSTAAVNMNQGSTALVVYASHGLVSLSQSANVIQATGYKISLYNTANVTYDTGLPSTLFQAGPGGGYSIVDWGQI